MLQRLVALLLWLFAAAAFAAVDVNQATQADLESIKGIGPVIATKILDERKKGLGEHNATGFSADGLTVNGARYAGGTSAKEKGSDMKKDAKGPGMTPTSSTSTPKGAATPTSSAAATDETRAQRAKERAAADEELRQKKAARKAAEQAAASAPAQPASAPKK